NATELHVLCHSFAMQVMAAHLMASDATPTRHQTRQLLAKIIGVWSDLRNADVTLLKGADPALIRIMNGAFTREAIRTFTCFEDMARHVITRFAKGGDPDPVGLAELAQFVTTELSTTIGCVVSAARLVADLGGRDMERLALTDDLTALPNRRAFHEVMNRANKGGWPDDHVTVMQIDLDRFKQINDGLGHAAGDAALRHAAKAMATHIRREDFIARLGGDEFTLLFFERMPETAMAERAAHIITDIAKPFVFNDRTCTVVASIGIAYGNRSDGIPLDRHMANADLALYTAKNGGRSTYRFFTPSLRTRVEECEALQGQIRQGLQNNEFEPFFQPQIEGCSGHLVGIEVLARWHHPTRGLLTPFHFLDAAKDADLLESLDSHLVDHAFSTMRGWLDTGLSIPQLSINLTADRLRHVNLVEKLVGAADRFGLPMPLIAVGILGSAMIDSTAPQMLQNIHDLSDAGFRIELDDFGTAHASIANLRNFKVDRIKIDQSFVKDIQLYSELAKITAAMIGLAHALRIDALAEGVETPEERLVLNALGCDHIQGFGVSRPMPGCDVPRWIRMTQKRKSLPPRRLFSAADALTG
ncbi:MAG: EAL domain-containing protein, partial [Alphaproteobacteria bacterium]|nr:EAL domain-containing protein [Alphaproteobacteria bacterium]